MAGQSPRFPAFAHASRAVYWQGAACDVGWCCKEQPVMGFVSLNFRWLTGACLAAALLGAASAPAATPPRVPPVAPGPAVANSRCVDGDGADAERAPIFRAAPDRKSVV